MPPALMGKETFLSLVMSVTEDYDPAPTFRLRCRWANNIYIDQSVGQLTRMEPPAAGSSVVERLRGYISNEHEL